MMIFTSIYGVVDGYFVSNFAGKEPFAAVNLIMPFIMVVSTIGFMFGDGVKAGELNQFTLKGYVFKTYEGRLIQAGFRGGVNAGATDSNLGSYVFDFSVENSAVADSLMRMSGKTIEVHYKEYLGALPWRGMQKHVVDRILSVKETP